MFRGAALKKDSFGWIRAILVSLGLLLEVSVAGGFYERRSHYPLAYHLIAPVMGFLGSVTALAIGGMLRWPKHKAPILVSQVVVYVAFAIYCLRLPGAATPGQLMIPVNGFVVITMAICGRWSPKDFGVSN